MAVAPNPARGREMRQNLLQKLRPPPLVHTWDFWHDRQDRNSKDIAIAGSDNGNELNSPTATTYETRLAHLASISDVRSFWSVFNNFNIDGLMLRDSIHLFHKGVKPVWEDPRNARGGSWTFRVPKQKAEAFWKEICMMAIGEQLQQAVTSDRVTFVDDICGVSLSTRFTSTLIQVWNRDAEHDRGIQSILQTVLAALPEELKPNESSYYYKKHAEHSGFKIESTELNPNTQTLGLETFMPKREDAPMVEDFELREEIPNSMAARGRSLTDNHTSGVQSVEGGVKEIDDTLIAMKRAMDRVGDNPYRE